MPVSVGCGLALPVNPSAMVCGTRGTSIGIVIVPSVPTVPTVPTISVIIVIIPVVPIVFPITMMSIAHSPSMITLIPLMPSTILPTTFYNILWEPRVIGGMMSDRLGDSYPLWFNPFARILQFASCWSLAKLAAFAGFYIFLVLLHVASDACEQVQEKGRSHRHVHLMLIGYNGFRMVVDASAALSTLLLSRDLSQTFSYPFCNGMLPCPLPF